MLNNRNHGQNHIYFDKHSNNYSNAAVGMLLRAIGHGLKVAYVNCNDSSNKLTNFLENLSLSYSFIKKFPKFHMDLFTFKKDGKISRTFLPNVEFNTINEDIFYKIINNNYDLVIYDQLNFNNISELKIKNLLTTKNKTTEIIMITNSYGEFEKIKNLFDLISIYKYQENKILGNKKSLINITGDGKGKSIFCFGLVIRNFIEKQDVKLIYFDKEGTQYGERIFFEALKKWSKENNMYAKFDYVSTGCQRFDGNTYRTNNTHLDIKEAKEGLMLLKTALIKKTVVIADELNTAISNNLLETNEISEIFNSIQNQLIISGKKSPSQIINKSNIIITLIDEKHYSINNNNLRKGIDY